MKEFWNQRYSQKEYVYGRTPNEFFKNFIDNLDVSGSIFLPAEGEGRNAVYAAKRGWEVYAVDYSEEARRKALIWAEQNQVEIKYEIADLEQWDLNLLVDVIALIFVHFTPGVRETFHNKLIQRLKPGGILIMEAFSKKQIQYDSGGPSDPDLLYSTTLLKEDFSGLNIDFLQERIVELDEGPFHNGEASVIRMIAKK